MTNRHRAVGLTHDQWRYAFTNTFSEEESKALYDRYHIPANGGILWGSVRANFQPGHQDTWVDYTNDKRAPLLFVSGSEDHIMPPAVQRSNLDLLSKLNAADQARHPQHGDLAARMEAY